MIIGLFAGSVAALAIFVWVEAHAAEPILPIRLFASPVFTVCCILGFIVGFPMLGALTFPPTFMQFVNGVSATTSGLRTPPMVAGMLITSIGSGQIVGRTGRYRIYPIAGTATMAVAFLLLSGMNAATPTWQQSLYLFRLGTAIGLCAGPRPGRPEHLGLCRSRGGHLWRYLLPSHRKFFRHSDFRQPVRELPRESDRACAGRKRRPAACCGITSSTPPAGPAGWLHRSWTHTPTRSAACSCARCPSR